MFYYTFFIFAHCKLFSAFLYLRNLFVKKIETDLATSFILLLILLQVLKLQSLNRLQLKNAEATCAEGVAEMKK